jgi:methylated-DNA-protein-cysteine methyltransferase-like protein
MKLVSRPSTPIKMTAFTKKVLALIKGIPKGKVASYGQIAKLAGKPQGSRGVGWILNSCTDSHNLPWQRVINSQGKISFPKDTKHYRLQKSLLLKEKVRLRDNDSIDMEVYGWKKKTKKISTPKNRPRMFNGNNK